MANTMRLTLQLSAIDNMSKVVSGAANRSMRSLNAMAQNAQQRANRARGAMFESGAMTAAGSAALAYPLKMAANYEMLRVRMIALAQSQSDGMKLYKQTIKLASETPLTLDQVATATTRLIGFGRTAKDAIVDVKMLGDVVTLAGGDINAAMIAYGQAAGEGRVMTRDLTQFVNAGVPIFKMLGEVTGANGAEIKKMAEQGQLSFDILYRAFENSTKAGGQFENGMAKMSKTASGGWVRMTDEMARFADVFGSSVLPMLKRWNEALIPMIASTSQWFREHEYLAKAVMFAVGAFTAFAAVGLVINGVIWVGATALSGFATAASFASFQVFRLRFAIFTSNLSLAAMGTWLQLVRLRVLTTAISMWTGFIPAVIAAATAVSGWTASLYAFTVALMSVPIIGWAIAAVSAFIAIGVAAYVFRDDIIAALTGAWDWMTDFLPRAWDWGANLVHSIVEGIKSAAPGLFAALDSAMTFARGFFPSSPAKRGAFRDINRIQIVEQVAKNIKPNSLGSAMQKATESGVGAIGPTASAQLASSGGGSMSINYSPTITIGAGSEAADKDGFTTLLERHKTEMARMVQDVMRQNGRKQFNYA